MENKSADSASMSIYGFPEESTKFNERHPLWSERVLRLKRAIDKAFHRTQVMNTLEEKFVYFYGNLIAEDFMEIFLLAVNGYGVAAMKLLRSMYEHTVTLRYLHDHPDEVQTFVNFHRVQQHKLMRSILETFGENALPPDTVANVQRRYEEVRDDYMVTDCKVCKTKRPNYSWSKLNFVAMAKQTGAIGSLIVPGYYLPLEHAHSTLSAIGDRMDMDDESMTFRRESQPELADQALSLAHNCVLLVLEIQHERFKIDGLEAETQACVRDWLEIWAPDSKLLRDEDNATSVRQSNGDC